MPKNKSSSSGGTTLREGAENRLSKKPRRKGLHDNSLSLIRELEVHQRELEMQNEESLKTRREIERSSEKYLELYDFAPVGYLTLGAEEFRKVR
jgi:hypothetical protein